ncbi:hypothetical protein L596_003431 [Steinernema carpocapsae]|uniref:Transmembrane protein 135 N-terminal domain-containing protein n=1 Tax=Steinernema carpocapsae TaxID=34508 RepID=A0A4U8UU44_STECR|nr:hypothetical protein L596_003431 [Steinernema carpocapsae]
MNILSKLFGGKLGFKILTAECYEYAHVWHPNCNLAIWDAVFDGFFFSFRTYATFYIVCIFCVFFAFVVECNRYKTGSPEDQVRFAAQRYSPLVRLSDRQPCGVFVLAMQSTVSPNFYQLLGFAIWPTVGFVNGWLSSFFAILLENRKRRPMLALYLTNLASETLYRQLVNHGYLRSYKHGECVPFAIGLAGFVYLYKQKQLDERMGKLVK